ncbi:hypothetical protein D3C71_1659390 [compost metagenome]
MQVYRALWPGLLAMVMAVATWMEYNAILRRIDGAKGFVLLMAGLAAAFGLALRSMPTSSGAADRCP